MYPSGMAASPWVEKILILAKTYPSPSARYAETSCIAGISQEGKMRRLFPVPFRLLQDAQQFKKWQWIEARIKKAANDHRPESHSLYIDGIRCTDVIDTKGAWAGRKLWLEKIPSFANADTMEQARQKTGLSLALIGPVRLVDIDMIAAKHAQWTSEELAKLQQAQMQSGLFSEDEAKTQIKTLRKLPFDFYYQYACAAPEGENMYRNKIIDWEAGALFWNCYKNYGNGWQTPFRTKLLHDMESKELFFLMGNQHRFPNQWLIISLIYPPKPTPTNAAQVSLF